MTDETGSFFARLDCDTYLLVFGVWYAKDDNLIADLFEMNHEYVLHLSSASTARGLASALPAVSQQFLS